MKEIELILEPIAGYLSSITRNTVDGWYELTMRNIMRSYADAKRRCS